MISGFLCVPFVKFVLQELDSAGIYFEKMAVLFPSFDVSMLIGVLFSKLYPLRNKNAEVKSNS